MAADVHGNKQNVIKLLRRPLPCNTKRHVPKLQTVKVPKCRSIVKKEDESNGQLGRGSISIYNDTKTSFRKCQVSVEPETEDLNRPDWVFRKPRGPDPFPLRPARKPFPFNKRFFVDDGLCDENSNNVDDSPEQLMCLKFHTLPPLEKNTHLGTLTPTNTLALAEDGNEKEGILEDSKIENLSLKPNAGLLIKEECRPITVLDLNLPEEINFQVRKPFWQALIEEKANLVIEGSIEDDVCWNPDSKDWASCLDPAYEFQFEQTGNGNVQEQHNNDQVDTNTAQQGLQFTNFEDGQDSDSNQSDADFEESDFDISNTAERVLPLDEVSKANSPPVTSQNCLVTVTGSTDITPLKTQVEEATGDCTEEGGAYLNLKALSLDTLPDLSSLQQTLVYINLSFNNFTQIPDELYLAKELEILKMRNNPILEISSRIRKLKKLRILELAFCCLSEFPPGLLKLHSLEQLDISYNELSSLPNDLRFLSNLREFNIEGNQLWALPRGILSLDLRSLNCCHNYLHPMLWRENAGPQPQKLSDLCATFIVRDETLLARKKFPKSVAKIFKSLSLCDYCAQPKVGPGIKLIKPVVELFGNVNLPIVFYICSQGCRSELKKATRVAAPIEVVEKP